MSSVWTQVSVRACVCVSVYKSITGYQVDMTPVGQMYVQLRSKIEQAELIFRCVNGKLIPLYIPNGYLRMYVYFTHMHI